MTTSNPDRWAAPNYSSFTGSDATPLQQTFQSLSTYLEKVTNAITIASGAGVLSLTGTANQITVSAATGAVTLSFPTNITLGGNVSVPANGKLIDTFATNYFTPRDEYGNMYHKLTSGSFYVDANNYYFRNQAATDLLTIDVNGNTFTRGNVYGSRSGAQLHMGAWTVTSTWGAIQGGNGYLLVTNTGTDKSIYLRTNNATGNVNIGGADNNTLVVSSSTVTCSGFIASAFRTGVTYGSYGSASLTVQNGGYVGWATALYSCCFMYNTDTFGHYRSNSFWNFYVQNGSFFSSDERWKRNITPIKYGMDFVNALQPVEYQRLTDQTDDPDETLEPDIYLGFTTQQVFRALDEIGEDRTLKMVNIGGANTTEGQTSDRQYLNSNEMIAPMVKALQELDQRLKTLEGAV